MLLAGDIGGTKTNLAVFSPEKGLREPMAERTFVSDHYTNLESLAQEFVDEVNLPITHASFGVAGPVENDEATITNLPWLIRASRLQEKLGLRSVRLLNDLEAIANAVPALTAADLYELHEGETAVSGNIAVIAPGTGLGEAFLTWDGSRHHAYASEGGHVDFAPTNRFETGLLSYLQEKRGYAHVSYENVCSGIGIPNIYDYLKNTGYADEPPWLTEALAAADDPTPIIANAATDEKNSCELCVATMNTFVSILGAEAGNVALQGLARGGVYLGGGIPPRILPSLENGRFLAACHNKGRMTRLLDRVSVYVILNPKTALLGAAEYGLQFM
jgi:glucokinase